MTHQEEKDFNLNVLQTKVSSFHHQSIDICEIFSKVIKSQSNSLVIYLLFIFVIFITTRFFLTTFNISICILPFRSYNCPINNKLFSSHSHVIPLGYVWIQGWYCCRRRKSQHHPVLIHALLRVRVQRKRKLSELCFFWKMKRKFHCAVRVPSHHHEFPMLPLLLCWNQEAQWPCMHATWKHEIPDLAQESIDHVKVWKLINEMGER